MDQRVALWKNIHQREMDSISRRIELKGERTDFYATWDSKTYLVISVFIVV